MKDLEKRYSATDAINHHWIQEKADEGLTTGTVGGGVTSQVIEDIHEVLKQAKIKNAALQYLTSKVTPNNINGLQEAL